MKASEFIQVCKEAMQLTNDDPIIQLECEYTGWNPVQNVTLDICNNQLYLNLDSEEEK